MTLLDKIKLIERVDSLICRKATGSPGELASKLELSERYVYKLINLMKDMGAPIFYCNSRRSYCYEVEVFFSVGFITKKNELAHIQGGKAHSKLELLTQFSPIQN